MALILNIETSTNNCSVSLSEGRKVISVKEFASIAPVHGENLHIFIEDAFIPLRRDVSEIQAVAVSEGPGSYTGLRIGVSAAKGLCFALGIPLIGIPTLEILASSVKVDSGVVIPVMDARRMEVYTAVYQHDGTLLEKAHPHILDHESFLKYLLKEPVHFVGDALEKTKLVVDNPNAHFYSDVHFPSARNMAELSYRRWKSKDFKDLAYFEPEYLKEFKGPKKKPS